MNNKGFAITSIIYGLMILFILVVTSFLSILIGRNRRMDELIDGVYDSVEYELIEINENEFDSETKTFVTVEKGLYEFINTDYTSCKVYLPKNVVVVRGEVVYPYNEELHRYFYYNHGGSENLQDYTVIYCF